MGAIIKLAARLPDGLRNGLLAGDVVEKFLTDPAAVQIAVLTLDTKSITTELDTGTQVPTARVLAVEVMDGPLADQALRMLADKYRVRTGHQELPFDPVTGEVLDDS